MVIDSYKTINQLDQPLTSFFKNCEKGLGHLGNQTVQILKDIPAQINQNPMVAATVFTVANGVFFSLAQAGANNLDQYLDRYTEKSDPILKTFKLIALDLSLFGSLTALFNHSLSTLTQVPISKLTLIAVSIASITLRYFLKWKPELLAKNSTHKNNLLQSQLTELKDELKQTKKELKEVEKELEDITKSESDLHLAIEQKSKSSEAWKQSNDIIREKSNKLLSTVIKKEKKIQNLREYLKTARDEIKRLRDLLDELKKSAQNCVEEQQGIILSLSQTIEDQKEEIKSLKLLKQKKPLVTFNRPIDLENRDPHDQKILGTSQKTLSSQLNAENDSLRFPSF